MSAITTAFNNFHDATVAYLQELINTTEPGTPEHEEAVTSLKAIEEEGKL